MPRGYLSEGISTAFWKRRSKKKFKKETIILNGYPEDEHLEEMVAKMISEEDEHNEYGCGKPGCMSWDCWGWRRSGCPCGE